jgi:hypothetical protein
MVKYKTRMTPERWNIFLMEIANGATRKNAATTAGVSYQTYQAYLISAEGATAQARLADVQWIRRDWPIERVEDICIEIAKGKTFKQACIDANLLEEEVTQLYRLLFHDPAINEIYTEARLIRTEVMMDELIEIADDCKDDKTGARINHDVVNRDALKIKTRQWIMGKMNFRRFGEKQQIEATVNVNVNHQETLDAARKRKERAHHKRTGGKTIQSTATEVA